MAILATDGTQFSTTATSFRVKSTGAASALMSKSDSGDPQWAYVGEIPSGRDMVVDNAATGTLYRINPGNGATVRAWDAN